METENRFDEELIETLEDELVQNLDAGEAAGDGRVSDDVAETPADDRTAVRRSAANRDVAAGQNAPGADVIGTAENGSASNGRTVKPAMEVKHLYFSYGDNKVLRDASLAIEKGKITTIMGANGCGKSTLFSLMTKNLIPRKGKVLLNGKNIQGLNLTDFAKKVSIVHQYNTSADDITVERLVAFGRTPHLKLMGGHTEEDERLIEWAMEVTNVTKYRDREVSRLSGGQRQRVWIAMALAQNTDILLLDEPTTYLDIRYQIEILRLVQKLNREYGITIIMVLHDINQAIHFSDYVIGLKDGKVIVEGDPETVITERSLAELYGITLGVTKIDGKTYVMTA